MTNSPEVIRVAQPSSLYIKALDGVRGLAILMVLGSHLFASNSGSTGGVTRFIGDVFSYGLFGVDLFFVLSGFLITGILVESVDDPQFFRKFYARRALRIFPLYYGVLLVLFLLTPLLHLHWKGMGWLLLAYLQNLRPHQISTFSPGSGISLSHLWSLAIEEQFYLVWPAIVFWVRDRRRLLIATIAISVGALALRLALIGAGASADMIHKSTITRADSLLLGGTLWLLVRSRHWPTIARIAPFGFVAAAGIILASIKFFGREFFPFTAHTRAMSIWIEGPRYTVLALASACLIAWALQPASLCQRVFQQRWLCFFGKYSYGIYVLHVIALPLLLGWQRATILSMTHSKLLAVVGAGIMTFFFSILVSYASFHLYEKPFLRLKHRFDYVRRRPVGSVRVTEEISVREVSSHLVNS